ncbi:MAG: TetR/AcrR family transcriptional regulator [Alphaproteobacteria bacterium]
MSTQTQTKPTRGAKRAAQTRAKLVRAAMEVMAEKGVDGATINDITDAADVAVGSFYNHFGTRDAIIKAAAQTMIEDMGQALDGLWDHVDDPVEVIATAMRIAFKRAMDDPAWGWFLLRTSERGGLITRGLGARLTRDLKAAKLAGRVQPHNVDHIALALVGTFMAFLSAGLQKDLSHQGGEDMAQTILILLGIPTLEAGEIAIRPIPTLETLKNA